MRTEDLKAVAKSAMSNIDIKSVIESIPKKANAQVYNGVRIKNVSIVAAKADNVRYWVTLTLDKAIRGSYVDSVVNEVPHYSIGLTTTVMVPVGTVVTCLFDSLFEIDDDTEINGITVEDAAVDLLSAKKAIVADFERMAAEPTHRSAISSLLIKASVNVISRDVFKEDGKVKSLFALNEKEVEVVRDSVWHDIYGISNIRPTKIVDVYKKFCVDAPTQPAAPAANPLQALLAALGGGNANVAKAALD